MLSYQNITILTLMKAHWQHNITLLPFRTHKNTSAISFHRKHRILLSVPTTNVRGTTFAQ